MKKDKTEFCFDELSASVTKSHKPVARAGSGVRKAKLETAEVGKNVLT